MNRLLLVNTTPPPGGGAIELKIPSGGWVMYGYQWPEASRANIATNAIVFRQAGVQAPTITVFRKDGVNGDTNFNPIYPFKMRGSVDASGNVIGGTHVSNLTYAIDVLILTNATFDILVRSDASAVNTLLELDGGTDLNSQMALGPTNGFDLRDNPPGAATDVFLGYEQAAYQLRNGPEKFAARIVARNNVTSLGAETYYYTVGGTNQVVNGSGNGASITTSTANWVYHDPAATNTAAGNGTATQLSPYSPSPGQAADIWVKVGNQFQTNVGYIYYTTDGSNPEGAFGVGKGTTKTVPASWVAHDSADETIDWFKGTIPGTANSSGTQIRYKVGLFITNIATISDADSAKLYGLTQFGITNFNPTNVTVWLHNDRNTNNTVNGLQSGFHILRARAFLPRSGKLAVYNTFLQTFYYDAALPTGVIAYPTTNGDTLTSGSYTVMVRADSSVTSVEFNIQDSDPLNDDAATSSNNGNGSTNGVPKFASASLVNADAALTAQHPNYPQEFRFNYVSVPNNSNATISVRLRGLAASVFTNRFTALTRTVKTESPASVVHVNNPGTDGQILILNTNDVYLLQTCFTSTLTTNDSSKFSLYLNGVFQPRNGFIFLPSGCGVGMRSLYYYWTNPPPGSNVIQAIYTNSIGTNQISLSDTRTAVVVRPGDSDGDGMSDLNETYAGTDPFDANSILRITGLENGHQLVVWDSVPGINYEVLATTNLALPFQVISPVIPASGGSSFYFDSALDATNKFYRIKAVP